MNGARANATTPPGIVAGARVGAVAYAVDGVVAFLGYGTYEGDFIPEEACGVLAEVLTLARHRVPRIHLDNGERIYGVECWWAPAADIAAYLARYQVMDLRVGDLRAQAAANHVMPAMRAAS